MKKCTVAIIAGLSLMALTFTSCGPSYKTVKRMQKLEEGVDSPTTKEELKAAIDKYEQRAMDLVAAQAQEGVWYKILGIRYLDEKMYGKALEAFQNALLYYPNNANLYYYVGVCAGYMANEALDFEAKGITESQEKRMNYLKLSESAYLQAISIDPKYYRALYGIGVLYTFELEENEKAIPYLEDFLAVQTKDVNAMFVLARAYYSCAEYDKAISLYDKIISLNPDANRAEEAQKNKKVILDAQSTR